MGKVKMTKAQALRLFRETHEEFLKKYRNDTIAKRTAWNDFVDMLEKDGDITPRQSHSWSNPF